MPPLLSICIPTYNRADLLDYCLTNLAPLKTCGKSIEIVISDNGSTDRTQAVIEAHRERLPAVRSFRFAENHGAAANWLNALRKADGDLVAQVADDDSLIIDNLLRHVQTLEQQKDLVAIYADWIAWDDQAGREIRRHYDGLTGPVSFGAGDPLGLVNFMLDRFYPPEIGIYRRIALVRVHEFGGRALPYYMRMYRLSRLGRVAFDPQPFYREHRILKDRFQRSHWVNMDMQFHMIGEELRLALEAMVLMAIQDAGAPTLPADLAPVIQTSIDRILHSRINLEVERACGRKDWIGAVELKRRRVLWHGPGSDADINQDVRMIVIPAALQAVEKTFRSLTDVSGLSLRGFESGKVAEFFAVHFPALPVLAADGGAGGNPLVLHRDEQSLARDGSAGDPARVMVLQHQLDLYRLARPRIDLMGF